MAKSAHSDVLDGGLNILKNNATRMCACSAQPTTYMQAITTYELADVTISGSDFTLSAGDTNGRKVRVAAKAGVPVDTAGTATHVALVDVANTKLLYVTTCASQALASGGTVDFPAWDVENADPV